MTHGDRMHADPGAHALESLVAEGLARLEAQGPDALDALCAEHPEHAAALRARFDALRRIGLLVAPRRLGPYRVLATLGRGGMGVVYRAVDERTGAQVALKALSARLASSARSLERFRREIQAVGQLRHPAIVPVLDVGAHDGTPFFTMDALDGRSLAAILEEARLRGQLPTAHALGERDGPDQMPRAAARIALEIAQGLEHAHRHGVVHRDVKPENVLLTRDGHARLLDFGLAHLADQPELTGTGEFAGTPYYAAPEQLRPGAASVDGRCDVWALGATLYELLTLERPFGGTHAADVIRRIALDDPVPPRRTNPAVPEDLQTICLTALQKRPHERYESARALAEDLQRFLDGAPIHARPVGRVRRLARRARRHPAASAALALAVLVALGTPLMLLRSRALVATQRDRAERAATDAAEQARAAQDALARAREALARVEDERARADAADARAASWLARAEAFDDWLLATLASHDALADDRDTTVVDALRRAAADAAVLGDDPEFEAGVRAHLAQAFFLLGLYEEALASLAAAWDVARPLEGGTVAALRFRILRDASVCLLRLGRHEDCERICLAALDLGAARRGPDDPDVLDLTTHLGRARWEQGDAAGARAAFARAVRGYRRTLPPDDPQLARAALNLATTLDTRDERTRDRIRAAQAALEAHAPQDDVEAATLVHNRYWIGFYELEPAADDIARIRHARDVARTRFGEDSAFVASFDLLLGGILGRYDDGDPAEIEALLRESEAIHARTAPGEPRRILALDWLGQLLAGQERHAEALGAMGRAVALRRALPDPDFVPKTERLVAQLAVLLRAVGRDAEADAILAETPGAAALFVERESPRERESP